MTLTGAKRSRDDSPDSAGGMPLPAKAARGDGEMMGPERPPATATTKNDEEVLELRPAPFFYYRDFSKQVDPDPLQPLTAAGRVPNFPAKMHAILSRPELADVIAWMPHGRSWRVLKPREFEIRVIPTYFEHAKFSSFIRQANGWGFRRLTQGRDRNSYYHELFLRGMPHLCKQMKRPGVAKKLAADPEHEPDFYKIAQVNPIPQEGGAAAHDESILLHCTIHGGPKARMPIYSGVFTSSLLNDCETMAVDNWMEQKMPATAGNARRLLENQQAQQQLQHFTPSDQFTLTRFHQALGASEKEFCNGFAAGAQTMNASPHQVLSNLFQTPSASLFGNRNAITAPAPTANLHNFNLNSKMSPLAAANSLAFDPNHAAAAVAQYQQQQLQQQQQQAQFTAGFVAATALSQQQLQNFFQHAGNSFGGMSNQQPSQNQSMNLGTNLIF